MEENREMKKVSAIITTRNRLELLKRAIDSVMAQTYPDVECIVVDDASTDDTPEYCQSLPVRYIRISPSESCGGNHARNVGIKAAQGEYVEFLDDDDYWLPQKTEKQVRLMEEKQCSLVYCGMRGEFVDTKGIFYKDASVDDLFAGDMSRRILMLINCCTSSLIMARKEMLLQIGMFDEKVRFWQDYELTVRAAQVTPFYPVKEILCVYRFDSMDKQRITNRLDGWEANMAYLLQKHEPLFARLNSIERIWRRRVWLRDSMKRYKKAGQKRNYRHCRLRFLLLSLLFLPAKLSVTLRHLLYPRELVECMRLKW